MKSILLSLVLTITLLGCTTTQYIPVETVKEKYINTTSIDTMYVKDSIFVQSKNDTVYLSKTQYIYRNKLVRDTIMVNDTIPIIKEVEIVKEVNVIKDWQTTLMILGGAFIAFIFLKLKKTIGI